MKLLNVSDAIARTVGTINVLIINILNWKVVRVASKPKSIPGYSAGQFVKEFLRSDDLTP
jgi:hypothetical protein